MSKKLSSRKETLYSFLWNRSSHSLRWVWLQNRILSIYIRTRAQIHENLKRKYLLVCIEASFLTLFLSICSYFQVFIFILHLFCFFLPFVHCCHFFSASFLLFWCANHHNFHSTTKLYVCSLWCLLCFKRCCLNIAHKWRSSHSVVILARVQIIHLFLLLCIVFHSVQFFILIRFGLVTSSLYLLFINATMCPCALLQVTDSVICNRQHMV